MSPVLDHEKLRMGGTTEIEKEVFTAAHKVLAMQHSGHMLSFPHCLKILLWPNSTTKLNSEPDVWPTYHTLIAASKKNSFWERSQDVSCHTLTHSGKWMLARIQPTA